MAKLAPLGFVTAFAAVCAALVQITDEIANSWMALGLLPLALYLGYSFVRARKRLLAETGREREIVQAEFIAIAAARSARFWGIVFAAITVPTLILSIASWGYQIFLWFDQGRWISVTWLNVTQTFPRLDHPLLQQSAYWLADTNFGAAVLVIGLLLAAPIAAIHWRANNRAKFRRNDLANLKQRS